MCGLGDDDTHLFSVHRQQQLPIQRNDKERELRLLLVAFNESNYYDTYRVEVRTRIQAMAPALSDPPIIIR